VLRAAACLAAAGLAVAAPAVAQTRSAPPGPWVLDVRGATSPVPADAAFYPTLDAAAFLPTRGYGLEVGAHVYLFDMGPARVGAGGSFVQVRATSGPDEGSADPSATPVSQRLTLNMRIIAPQVSFNFGSRDGWSYVSAGAGTATVETRTEAVLPGARESGGLFAWDVGGGARWFLKSRFAIGFDVRLHRIASGTSTPSTTFVSVSAGISIR